MVTKFNNNKNLYEEFRKKDSPLDNTEYIIHEYNDYFQDGNAKRIKSKNLGEKFASINAFFFDYLKEYHIPSAFVKNNSKKSLEFLKFDKFLFYLKILNLTDKRTAKIFGEKEGNPLNLPIYEYHFGDGKDSLITESHLISYNLCTNEDLKIISRIGSKINAVLRSFFERRNLILAEVCCNFGKCDDKIYLVDDFTPKSLKVLPADNSKKWSDPYNLSTSARIRNYTNQIYNLTSA